MIGIQLPAETWITPMIIISLPSIPPCPILHRLRRVSRHSGSGWQIWWEKTSLSTLFFHTVVAQKGLDLKKGIYRSPYVMCNLPNGDRITLPRFVVNWDLALELLVSQPLRRSKKV